MAHDALRLLARLRRIARDAACRDLAEAERARVAADAAHRAAAEAPLREMMHAAPSDYGAWLPVARRACATTAAQLGRAEAAAEVARQALVAARAEAEALERLRAMRRAAQRRARLSREQAALEDAARRRPLSGGLEARAAVD
jgi:hypothetical protein